VIWRLAAAVTLAVAAILPGVAAVSAAGPPFPDPVDGQRVYDTASVFRQGTIQAAAATILAIEKRTGSQVVVYSQLVPGDTSDQDALDQALALMNQWGVGRKGIDDGLVILFDIYEGSRCHGRVDLYAGAGFKGVYLSDSERQAIFDNDMLPLLRGCDLDGALLAALAKVDAAATPEHAATLERGRQLDAVLGLLVAPMLFVLLLGYAVLAWTRHGRDPVYLDDASIHIPAPPAGLTPAAGAALRDGQVSRRALTTASLDLARRGLIAFSTEKAGLLGTKTELSIALNPQITRTPEEEMRVERAQSRPMDDATSYLATELRSIGGADGVVDPAGLLKLGARVTTFNSKLEDHLVANGWFTEAPRKASGRWVGRGILIGIVGGVVTFIGANLPSAGLVTVGVALIVAGVAYLILAGSMPSRTMPGAMLRAMLEAYRRTLQKTMTISRSMEEVAKDSAIPLIESPDDAVVWGVALGLHDEVEAVLERSAQDLSAGATQSAWMPLWYGSAAQGFGSGGGGGGGWAPGVMSSSPIPNFGGMMSALGTIGNSPSSSGSGGGGGFGGGGGGGGGGAGGGF
jgi:uncharacterized membrane protein YgcG